jgi:hypothetical protein
LRFDFNFWVFVVIEKENLCLYGHPNESWEVNLPAEEVPPELPEPALGINSLEMVCRGKIGFLLLLFTVIVGCSLFLSTLEPVLIAMRGISLFPNILILHSHCFVFS